MTARMHAWLLSLNDSIEYLQQELYVAIKPKRLTVCRYSPWNSLGQNTGVGCLSLLQRIFPAQESNWGLLHCRQILYQRSYQGSPKCD